SVDVNGAGTTLGNTAAVFRAGEANLLSQHPEQRSARVDINVVGLSVDAETSHSQPPVDRQFIGVTVRAAVTRSACARPASITSFHSNVVVAKSRGPPRIIFRPIAHDPVPARNLPVLPLHGRRVRVLHVEPVGRQRLSDRMS